MLCASCKVCKICSYTAMQLSCSFRHRARGFAFSISSPFGKAKHTIAFPHLRISTLSQSCKFHVVQTIAAKGRTRLPPHHPEANSGREYAHREASAGLGQRKSKDSEAYRTKKQREKKSKMQGKENRNGMRARLIPALGYLKTILPRL